MRSRSRFLTVPLLVSMLVLSSAARSDAGDEISLTFIHLNDTYRVDALEEGRRGGFGRVTTLVRKLLEQGRDVRILHGGDFLYPSLESALWDGEQMVEAMNFLDGLAPLYVVPGNHEFDRRGASALTERLHESRFDWLGDNLALRTGDTEADDVLRQEFSFMAGNRKVGVFALTLHPDGGGNVRDYAPVAGDYVAVAERVISLLERDGADLIIGLTHLNLADDIEVARLKSRHPRFMFIAGGHEHEPEFQAGDDKNAAIVKGASNARIIWQVDVRFDDDVPAIAARQIDVDESIVTDPEYQPIADKWRNRLLDLMPFLPARIGTATIPMDSREVTIRNEESSWGNYIADQMRGAFGSSPSDLAFVNSGTLRIDDFIAEDITFEDIGRTFGFSSHLRHLSLTGAEFRQLMEAGYRGEGGSKGYFPQVSGFRICVDRERSSNSRIVSLQVPVTGGWQEISDNEVYTLVMPDYLFGGGDGYRVPEARKNAASLPGSELKYLVLDAIIGATAEGRTVGEPVDPGSPRFVQLGPDRAACFR